MIYTIASRKGGTAKTTTAHAIGSYFAIRGKKVLFVDLDSQANLTSATGANKGTGTADALTGKGIRLQTSGNISVLSAQEDLVSIEPDLSPFRLREVLETLKPRFDLIIIDTPAYLGRFTVSAFIACDRIIITSQPQRFCLDGIEIIANEIEAIKEGANKNLTVEGILLTFSKRTILRREMRERIKDASALFQTKVFETKIRECEKIGEAQDLGISVFEYAPTSNAAKDYEAFIQELDYR